MPQAHAMTVVAYKLCSEVQLLAACRLTAVSCHGPLVHPD